MNRRRIATIAIAASLVVLTATTAAARWGATATGAGTAKSVAMPAGGTPTKPVATPTTAVGSIVVEWPVANYPGVTPMTAVGGYAIKRYKAGVLDGTGPAAACAGTLAVLTCTDTVTVAGAYTYTVTPVSGTSSLYKGTESAQGPTYNYAPAASSASKFDVNAPATFTAGTSATVTVTAQRADNSTDTNYTGALTWSGTAFQSSPNSATPTAVLATAFSNGVATYSVRLTRAATSVVLTATQGSLTGSDTLTVNVAKAALGFTSTTVGTSSVTCSPTVSTNTGGNKTVFATRVRLLAADIYGNALTLPTAGSVSVTVTKSGNGDFGPVSGSPQTINLASSPTSTANYQMERSNSGGFTGGVLTIADTGNMYAPTTCLLHG